MKKAMLKIAAGSIVALSLAGVAMPTMADNMHADKFVKMCDTDKDGMVSKEEMMKHVEKMWAKMDAKKTGKMDTKQTDAFLKELMKTGG